MQLLTPTHSIGCVAAASRLSGDGSRAPFFARQLSSALGHHDCPPRSLIVKRLRAYSGLPRSRVYLPKWPPISVHAMSKASEMVFRASGPNDAPSISRRAIAGVGTVGEALIRRRDDQHDLPCLGIGHAGGHDASFPFKPAPVIHGVSRHGGPTIITAPGRFVSSRGPATERQHPRKFNSNCGATIAGMPSNSVGSRRAGTLRHLPATA